MDLGDCDLPVSPQAGGGVGDVGQVGVAAAVPNAVHHAAGRRVRSLPITVGALL
jgi:xanthine dehydrogenase YagR molybdenum-binding subunit